MVLGTSILSFVYSVAEYCVPVRFKSENRKKVDTEVNHASYIGYC